jgi:hypothetical protein
MWKGEWSKSDNHVLFLSFKYLSDGHIIIVDCEIFSLWYYVSKVIFSYFVQDEEKTKTQHNMCWTPLYEKKQKNWR